MNLYTKYKDIWDGKDNNLETIYHYIKNHKWSMDSYGNITVTSSSKKEIPAFCCHLDTVHKAAPAITCIDNNVLVSFNEHGVGGDDKCGIVACLELLQKVPCKVIFFREEERGCIGSSRYDTSSLRDNLYLIEIDRKGASDLIFNSGGSQLCSDQFKTAVKTLFGDYKAAQGICTDVNVLGDANINMMNISCGYYNPHTKKEYVVLSNLEKTIKNLAKFARLYKYKEEYTRPEVVLKNQYTYYKNNYNATLWDESSLNNGVEYDEKYVKQYLKELEEKGL